MNVSGPLKPFTRDEEIGFKWLRNNPGSSVEERIFIFTFMDWGFNSASELAGKFRWKCQRPLQELKGK